MNRQVVGQTFVLPPSSRCSLMFPTIVESPPPLKTYAKCYGARTVSMSARMEQMEQAIHEITSKQHTLCARNLPTIRSAIEAVVEVSVGFAHPPSSKTKLKLCQCSEEMDAEISALTVTPFHTNLCICANVFQRFLKVTWISVITVVRHPLIHSCTSSFPESARFLKVS